jgi:glycosyltransferase involved in cell wall biosynthesis
MRAADIFCQPNAGPEPFGIVFIEALAAGLPVVATKMGGAVEIVVPSCGLLVEANGASVAEALDELIRDERKRREFSMAGTVRAHELCAPAARVRDLAAVLGALVEGPTAGIIGAASTIPSDHRPSAFPDRASSHPSIRAPHE